MYSFFRIHKDFFCIGKKFATNYGRKRIWIRQLKSQI